MHRKIIPNLFFLFYFSIHPVLVPILFHYTFYSVTLDCCILCLLVFPPPSFLYSQHCYQSAADMGEFNDYMYPDRFLNFLLVDISFPVIGTFIGHDRVQ